MKISKNKIILISISICLLVLIATISIYSAEHFYKEFTEVSNKYIEEMTVSSELKINNDILRSSNEDLQEQLQKEKELNVSLEVYRANVSCDSYELTFYNETGNNTATGTVPKHLQTVAVDSGVIPLGTRLTIEGYEGVFIAEDTGGAVKGNIIDIFYSGTDEELIQLGRKRDIKVCIYE